MSGVDPRRVARWERILRGLEMAPQMSDASNLYADLVQAGLVVCTAEYASLYPSRRSARVVRYRYTLTQKGRDAIA